MNKAILALALCSALTACMTLPGSDVPPPAHYVLQATGDNCEAGDKALSLSVVKVATGLDSDRIARRDAATGEITYLKGAHWASELGPMLEQRLAADLECKGFTVLTSHHRKLKHDQMVCEVRALNLVDQAGSDQAEVSLSCLYFGSGERADQSVHAHHSSSLNRWSADAAVSALSDAYREVFEQLVSELP